MSQPGVTPTGWRSPARVSAGGAMGASNPRPLACHEPPELSHRHQQHPEQAKHRLLRAPTGSDQQTLAPFCPSLCPSQSTLRASLRATVRTVLRARCPFTSPSAMPSSPLPSSWPTCAEAPIPGGRTRPTACRVTPCHGMAVLCQRCRPLCVSASARAGRSAGRHCRPGTCLVGLSGLVYR